MSFLTCLLWLCAIAVQTLALGPQIPKTRPSGLPTYTPNGNDMDATAFSNWVNQQAGSGVKTLALAQGEYNVDSPNNDRNTYILFQGLSGVTIWMDSVNLTFADNKITAFTIDTCDTVTTYGPTIWWAVPGFGQATITSSTKTADSTYQVQYRCDAGYDCSSMTKDGSLSAEYTNPSTGLLEAGPGWSTFEGPITAVDDNTSQYTYENAYFAPLVGHKLLSRGTFLFCNLVQNSNDTSINDFTALNCGGFFYFSTANRRTAFNSVAIRPADFAPPGGTELPARACSADGIHSASDYIGPRIDSSLFSMLDDDCIAVHGSLATTSGSVSGNSFTGSFAAETGHELRFYTPDSMKPIGTATVTQAKAIDGSGNTLITVDSLPDGFTAGSTVYTDRNRVGSGFSITNVHTTGNRGRGFIIKASDGVISDNVLEGVTYAGIFLGPEFKAWKEADYVSNLTISNNKILNSAYLNKGGSAFSLHGDSNDIGSSDDSLNPVNGNSDIRISNLLISDTGSPSNIYIGASTGVSMTGVTIRNALQANYTLWESTPNAIVNFQNVQFSGTVSICQTDAADAGNTDNNGGDDGGDDGGDSCLATRDDAGNVVDVKVYGTVTGGITSIPQC